MTQTRYEKNWNATSRLKHSANQGRKKTLKDSISRFSRVWSVPHFIKKGGVLSEIRCYKESNILFLEEAYSSRMQSESVGDRARLPCVSIWCDDWALTQNPKRLQEMGSCVYQDIEWTAKWKTGARGPRCNPTSEPQDQKRSTCCHKSCNHANLSNDRLNLSKCSMASVKLSDRAIKSCNHGIAHGLFSIDRRACWAHCLVR